MKEAIRQGIQKKRDLKVIKSDAPQPVLIFMSKPQMEMYLCCSENEISATDWLDEYKIRTGKDAPDVFWQRPKEQGQYYNAKLKAMSIPSHDLGRLWDGKDCKICLNTHLAVVLKRGEALMIDMFTPYGKTTRTPCWCKR